MASRNYFSRTLYHKREIEQIYKTKIKEASIVNALGLVYLQKYLSGLSIPKIAKMVKHHQATVTKYMATAASRLVEDAHSKMIQDLVPLAQQVYSAKLKQDLADIANGKAVDLKDAERVLQGMFVFDSPQLLQPVETPAQQEIESIGMVVAKLRESKPKQLAPILQQEEQDDIEGEVVTDGNKDNPVI